MIPTWSLASDPATSYATRADILALAHASGTPGSGPGQASWRTEALGFNPLADLPVDHIGVNFVGGHVVDYTVQITDRDGTFYVWARNLDRALQLQDKTGDAREFNLRNYEIDFAHLDEVNSSTDSTYRVELLTPAQFHFAVLKPSPRLLTSRISHFTDAAGRRRQNPICQEGSWAKDWGVPAVWRGVGMRPQHACMEATCAANDDAWVCWGVAA